MPSSTPIRAVLATLAVVLVAGATPPAAQAAPPSLAPTEIASGLSIPWDVAFAPDGKMLVTERVGRVRVYSGGHWGASLLRTVNFEHEVWASGEAGLMGIAVDVDFVKNPYVYLCRTRDPGPVNQVVRYELRGDGSLRNPVVLIDGMAAANIHNGCAVDMDRHGLLWVTMGDANNKALPQNRNSLNGKVLRIHRDGSIPADNPVIAGTRDQVYSMGHRNPQGIAFRPGTDQVYVVEHGPEKDDEINIMSPGANYGWPCYTGAGAPYETGYCGGAAASNYANPAWASGSPTIATSGAAFVNGAQWGDWNGHLFVSTLKQSDVRRFGVNSDGSLVAPQTLFDAAWGRLRAMVLGPGGQLYVTTSNGSNDRVIRISAFAPVTTRISGPDRYSTAVAVSQSQFPSGASEVIVATGENFPDALAGSAVAARLDMPVLLVTAHTVPASTLAEVDRLNPLRIWVLGGEAVVSETVRQTLAQYATTGQAVRIAGADRYATAAAVSQNWYLPNVPAVFVATGRDFPDALAGAPAAALNDAPLLLVQTNEIPAATDSELRRLLPQRIYVLGGSAVVSDLVATTLQGYTSGPVVRLWGANRYETAASVSRAFWGLTDVYVATGQNFPDALAGGAAAGRNGVPMLLASTNAAPVATGQEILRVQGTRMTILGGTGALSTTAEAQLRALLGVP